MKDNMENETQTLIDGIRYDIADALQALKEAQKKLEDLEALSEPKDEF